MDAREMQELIGKQGYLYIEELVVAIQIISVRMRFGREDFLVTPLHGKKEQWVSSARVDLDSPVM